MKKIVILVILLLLIPTVFNVIPKTDNNVVTIISAKPTNKLGEQTPDSYINYINEEKTQLSFAAFSDTHIGSRYQFPSVPTSDYLDLIGEDLIDNTNLLDFAIHLGDIVNHNTGHVNGEDLPWYVNQYKNNLKAYLISKVNIPFHFVIGNHDVNDYEMNADDPHMLTKSIIDETSMNNPVYAMMRDGILFLILPELAYVHWTHPVEYEWIEYMTDCYPETTTIILCHQAIEDTTIADYESPYRGKQDMDWWSNLFQNNPQIKMWINGHNHCFDWYVNDQTTGVTQGYPIYHFGHEMLFAAPYSQWIFNNSHEKDIIAIYNITSSSISTITWQRNRREGFWSPEHINSWDVSTTFDPNAKDWYSFPMFLQDNETQLTDMKLLSPDVTVQLIGTVPMELFYDSKFEVGSSKPIDAPEFLLGFGEDRSGNVEWTNPGGKIHGPTFITFPSKTPYSTTQKKLQEDGRSGQPYQSFPMGTICAAVPGQTYNFTMTARSESGEGEFRMRVNCSDWITKSQYSVLPESEIEVFSHTFGLEYETIYGTYTVPDDNNAWFLQGILEFLNSTDYDISYFSVKRERNSDKTEDFNLCLSGNWYNVSGVLEKNEVVNFSVDPINLSDYAGVMNFTAFIDGNRYGMVNLIYREPLLLSRNTRFRVNNYTNDVFNLSLTKTISQNSPVKMKIWSSKLFQKFPFLTEFFSRFLISGLTGRILNFIFRKASVDFKMFPFSTDPMYDQVNISAEDGSGTKHVSDNGNLWFSCNGPKKGERFVEVTLPK